jgi:hypothetical protein
MVTPHLMVLWAVRTFLSAAHCMGIVLQSRCACVWAFSGYSQGTSMCVQACLALGHLPSGSSFRIRVSLGGNM